MNRAILHLKSGGTFPYSVVDEGLLQQVVDCVQGRGDRSRSFPLHAPDGGMVSVPARDVAAVDLAPPFCVIKNFLKDEELARAETFALAHEKHFEDATVSLPSRPGDWQPDYGLRRSRVLNDVGELMPMLVPKLNALMPRLWHHLRMAPLGIGTIECQMAVHGEGGYFRTHTDNGVPDIAHRMVSYVYYFHREPRQFSGGTLRFHGTLVEADAARSGQLWAEIPPLRNGLVVFPSNCFHEVSEMTCASTALEDQRLSINGWLCA